MKTYIVTGPMMRYVMPMLDDGTGPEEEWCEVYTIRAPNAKAAKWAAWRIAKEAGKNVSKCWPDWVRINEIHPLSGTRAWVFLSDVGDEITNYDACVGEE